MIDSRDGRKYDCVTGDCTPYTGSPLDADLEIEVRYELGNLSFVINGKNHGIAFDKVSASSLFFVQFRNCEGDMSFVEVSNLCCNVVNMSSPYVL